MHIYTNIYHQQGFHVGIAPPTPSPNNPSTSQKLDPDAKRCGVIMLDYKDTDPVDDIWESGRNLRNNVKSFFK